MTNKLRNNTIKSYKNQNKNRNSIKPVDLSLDTYFTSKITPSFYQTYVNKMTSKI